MGCGYGLSPPLVAGAVDIAGFAMPLVGVAAAPLLLLFMLPPLIAPWCVIVWRRAECLLWCIAFAEAGVTSSAPTATMRAAEAAENRYEVFIVLSPAWAVRFCRTIILLGM